MFVYSFKANKKTIIGAVLVITALAVLFIVLPGRAGQTNAILNVSLKAQTNQQRIEFLSKFGYDVISEPKQTKDIIIPEQFDDTYNNYNELQKQQGFNLESYKGKCAKSYSYAVKNYPDMENSENEVRANLIVYNGKIIGGDICSVRLDGFMHAFNYGKT